MSTQPPKGNWATGFQQGDEMIGQAGNIVGKPMNHHGGPFGKPLLRLPVDIFRQEIGDAPELCGRDNFSEIRKEIGKWHVNFGTMDGYFNYCDHLRG